jgi:hypothetical protein
MRTVDDIDDDDDDEPELSAHSAGWHLNLRDWHKPIRAYGYRSSIRPECDSISHTRAASDHDERASFLMLTRTRTARRALAPSDAMKL